MKYYLTCLLCVFYTTYIHANTLNHAESSHEKKPFAYRATPLSISVPLDILQQAASHSLDVLNFGLSGDLDITYTESLDNVDFTSVSPASINFSFAYVVTPYINFYGSTTLNTTPLISPSTIVPVFANSLTTTNMALVDGFFTIGNLNYYPVYGYFGQLDLPYASNYVPLSNNEDFSSQISTITQRAIGIGHSITLGPSVINTEYFLFNGDSIPTSATNTPTTGFNIIMNNTITTSTNLSLKAGFITNLADTNGYQNTTGSITTSARGKAISNINVAKIDNSPSDILAQYDDSSVVRYYYDVFSGFGTTEDFEYIDHRVAGVAFALSLSTIGDINLTAAFSTAIRPFSPLNLSFTANGPFPDDGPTDDDGARPAAANIYLSKSFPSHGLSFYGGYEKSSQALGLSIPQHRVLLGFTKTMDNFTTISVEAKKDYNYGVNCDARGPYNSTLVNADFYPNQYSIISAADPSVLGNSSTAISAQLNISF